nr:uncharacterized protein LOC123755396 isoform X2 [Procambarus clarkii]
MSPLLLFLPLVLWARSHPGVDASSPLFASQEEVSSSLVVNQLAILKMMGDSSNSCSTAPVVMEKLEAQLQQDKEVLHGAMSDLLEQITQLKNETTSGFEDVKGELRSILEAYQDEVTTYKSQVNNITGKMTTMEVDQRNSLENVSTSLQVLENMQQEAVSDYNDQIRSLTSLVESLQEKLLNNTLEEMFEELKRTQIALQEEINTCKSQVSSLTTELREGINTSTSQVNSLNTELQGELNTYKSQVSSLSTELQEEINTCKSQVSSFNTVLEGKINTCSAQVTAHTAQITTLEGKVQLNSLLTQFTRSNTAPVTCSGDKELTAMSHSICVVTTGNYSDNLSCSWKVTLPPGTKILLKWSYFELEYSSDCRYDSVVVQDLTRDNQLVYGHKLCGSHLPGDKWIDSNMINIVFGSDGSKVFRGFGLDYKGI